MKVFNDSNKISCEVETSVKIDMLMTKGYCWTSKPAVKHQLIFLLNLFDVKYSYKYVVERYVFRLE